MNELDLARAIIARVDKDARSPTVIPATVVGLDDDPDAQPIPLAHVEVDGNPPGMVNVVPIATTGRIAIGQRVLVHFDPPSGAYIIGVITGASDGSRPYATRVVAAANSVATDARLADYVCDGTDDDVEIQQAIDDLAGIGGTVLLLEGTFSTSSTIIIPTGVEVRGQGPATAVAPAGPGDWAVTGSGVARRVTAQGSGGV